MPIKKGSKYLNWERRNAFLLEKVQFHTWLTFQKVYTSSPQNDAIRRVLYVSGWCGFHPLKYQHCKEGYAIFHEARPLLDAVIWRIDIEKLRELPGWETIGEENAN